MIARAVLRPVDNCRLQRHPVDNVRSESSLAPLTSQVPGPRPCHTSFALLTHLTANPRHLARVIVRDKPRISSLNPAQ